MTEDFRHKLLADIKKTGYPIELEVGNIISKHSKNVNYNQYYFDKDEQKGNEIDVTANMNSYSENVLVGLNLICEVKKSPERPWVIFSTRRTSIEYEGYLRMHYGVGVDANILSFEDMQKKATSTEFSRIGRSYYEGFKSDDQRSQIFKALTSAVKASEECAERNDPNSEENKDWRIEGQVQISFVEPIVVLDGLLFEAYLDEKDTLKLDQIDYIPISFGYISSQYKRSGYLVDVVTIKELPNLLSGKQAWIDYMKDAIVRQLQ